MNRALFIFFFGINIGLLAVGVWAGSSEVKTRTVPYRVVRVALPGSQLDRRNASRLKSEGRPCRQHGSSAQQDHQTR